MACSIKTLEQWLAWQEQLHPEEIELGLDRCGRVAGRMNWPVPPFPILIIAGTNGKGSSVIMLEAILLAAGYRTGIYISPHIRRYNERVRLSGEEVTDAALCTAFERIERVRNDTSLTYFEFGTLAAMDVFYAQSPDVVILEVGLGGRLDAVNLFTPYASLITSIDIDHVSWLGNNREDIGREKAGIFRPHRPAICADPDPPDSIGQTARQLGSDYYCANRDFRYSVGENGWDWIGGSRVYGHLPIPRLRGECQLQNAAGVLMLLESVKDKLPVTEKALREGMKSGYMHGRMEVLPGPVEWILDVAHNPAAVEALAAFLDQRSCSGQTFALFGLMADKELNGVIIPMLELVDSWYVARLPTERSMDACIIARGIKQVYNGAKVSEYMGLAEARTALEGIIKFGDRVVAFGSFYTVAQVLS